MWLVMELQGDGSMEPKCRPRKCLETGSVWDPVTCRCSVSEEGCEDGEQLYIDVFGQGVCGCRDTIEEEVEEDEEVTTQISRVFDVIPSGGNSINHNTNNMIKVTQQTCVLDARGKCRRKIKFKRNGDNSDARAQEFKIWLQSFQKRAPNNFNCSS